MYVYDDRLKSLNVSASKEFEGRKCVCVCECVSVCVCDE